MSCDSRIDWQWQNAKKWHQPGSQDKFKFNEATPRGVPGPVFITKMTPPRLPAGVRSLGTSTSPPLLYQYLALALA